MSTITIEALKEAGRFFISSLLGTLVTCLGLVASGINLKTGDVSINWKIAGLTFVVGLITGTVGAIARFTDKWQYEYSKEMKSSSINSYPTMGWLNYFIK